MAKKSTNFNHIIPDFTEELVSFMIQHFLTFSAFPSKPFFMMPLSTKEENSLGADVKIKSVRPLYIQLKRCFGYVQNSKASFLAERRKLGLSNNPLVLYFELREKGKKQNDFQHNILFRLRRRLKKSNLGDAFYVAPLFHKRTAYSQAVYFSSLLSLRPWGPLKFSHYHYLINSRIFGEENPSGKVFTSVPIFKKHVSIPPHDTVEDAKHKYSFLEDGSDICFHSPLVVDGGQSFGQSLDSFFGFQNNEFTSATISLGDSRGLLNDLMSIVSEGSVQNARLPLNNDSRPILEAWADFGVFLQNEFQIKQFLWVEYEW